MGPFWVIWAHFESVGHFRSIFGFWVTLGPLVSGGQFRVLGSLWVHFWSGGQFGSMFGLGANLGQCLVWWILLTDFGLEGYSRAILCHFGSFLGLVVT